MLNDIVIIISGVIIMYGDSALVPVNTMMPIIPSMHTPMT